MKTLSTAAAAAVAAAALKQSGAKLGGVCLFFCELKTIKFPF